MKKLLALTLLLAVALGLIPAAAQESVTPAPPAWCPEDEYAVFPGSAAYEPGNWDIITQTRGEVAQGPVNLGALPLRWKFHGLPAKQMVDGRERYDFGVLLEQALVETRLLYTHDDYNGPYWTSLSTVLEDGGDEKLDGLTDQQRYALLLWTARGILRYEGVGPRLDEYLPYLMEFPQFSLSKLTENIPYSDARRAELDAQLQNHIGLFLDGKQLSLDVDPEVKNQRTMVPIRAVGEAIGADVEWVQDKQQVVMTRAGSTVTMTLNSTTAYIDGKAEEMDVAPYAVDGRTLLPARYVAEFFGQKVDWDGKKRQVLITQDKSAAGDSNLEQWALAMGLTYAYQYYDYDKNFWETNSPQFGMYPRTAEKVQDSREGLERNWGGSSREHIISIVEQMTAHGHNDSFLAAAADVKLRTPEERAAISALSGVWGEHMWTFTEELDKKWGDKGILAWDLSRMGAMVQWGYHAGRLTYEEALALVEPAARLAAENFSSWEEFYENYLDGYNWWARNNVVGMDPWETERGPLCREMLKNPVLDDALFQTGVIPLPDGT